MTAYSAITPAPVAPPPSAERDAARTGLLLGIGAYLSWGFLPVYMKALGTVPAPEILAHRILWSLALITIIVVAMRRWQPVVALLKAPKVMGVLAITATLIAVNWLVYIWAVNAGQVLETSLGYFINPLVNVAMGVIILRERLRRVQAGAVGLAAVGVGVLAIAQGGIPWIALVLAFSFATYGLLRKMAPVDPLTGLLGETALLAPVSLGFLLWVGAAGTGSFGQAGHIDMLLIISGLVTAAPLLMFAAAGKRLPYATIGLLQFIAPTIQFLLAVLVYGEPLTDAHLITFTCIWTGLIAFAIDTWRASRIPLPVAPVQG